MYDTSDLELMPCVTVIKGGSYNGGGKLMPSVYFLWKRMMETVKPIRPDQVKPKTLPPEVIIAFNSLISENFRKGRSTITQDAVLKRIMQATGVSRQKIIDNDWLEIEDLYRNAGWKVEYDKPGFNETYDAMFIFTQNSIAQPDR